MQASPSPIDEPVDGADRDDEGEHEDPVLSATRDYLTDLKAPLYAQLSSMAQEVSAITSVKVVRSYAADGELDLYTPACLAQRYGVALPGIVACACLLIVASFFLRSGRR